MRSHENGGQSATTQVKEFYLNFQYNCKVAIWLLYHHIDGYELGGDFFID
jgi:hypothetical protein